MSVEHEIGASAPLLNPSAAHSSQSYINTLFLVQLMIISAPFMVKLYQDIRERDLLGAAKQRVRRLFMPKWQKELEKDAYYRTIVGATIHKIDTEPTIRATGRLGPFYRTKYEEPEVTFSSGDDKYAEDPDTCLEEYYKKVLDELTPEEQHARDQYLAKLETEEQEPSYEDFLVWVKERKSKGFLSRFFGGGKSTKPASKIVLESAHDDVPTLSYRGATPPSRIARTSFRDKSGKVHVLDFVNQPPVENSITPDSMVNQCNQGCIDEEYLYDYYMRVINDFKNHSAA